MTLDGAAIAPDALSDMQLQFSAPPNDNGYALVGVVAGLDLRLGRGKLIHACVARPPSPLGPSPCVPLPANGSAACSPRWPDRSGAFSPTAPRGRSWEERARSAFNRRFRAVRFGAVLAPPDPELAVTLGDGQSAAGTQAFGTPLEVSIRTSWGAPTPGVRVDFSAPAGAATAVFPNFSSTFSVLTDRSGRAQAPCQASCQAGTFISYLVARPSRDLIVMARQQLTQEWWSRRRPDFEAYASQLVLAEAAASDPEAAQHRAVILAEFPVLDLSNEATALAGRLVEAARLPERARADALHIAIAACHGIEYLLTWNAAHIANAELRPLVERACRASGYAPPVLCTPDELMGV